MCEFCTKHGEGKKWYLQMKNYADELPHEELSSTQKEIVKATTHLEWNNRFWENYVMPAMGAVSKARDELPGAPPCAEPPEDEPFAAETAEDWKVEHFGQVLPMEDVEKVIDMVDSITRLPCGCRFISIGKTDKRYCFGLGIDKWGILGKYPDAASSLEVVKRQRLKGSFASTMRKG